MGDGRRTRTTPPRLPSRAPFPLGTGRAQSPQRSRGPWARPGADGLAAGQDGGAEGAPAVHAGISGHGAGGLPGHGARQLHPGGPRAARAQDQLRGVRAAGDRRRSEARGAGPLRHGLAPFGFRRPGAARTNSFPGCPVGGWRPQVPGSHECRDGDRAGQQLAIACRSGGPGWRGPPRLASSVAVEGGALIRSSRDDVGMRGEGSGPNPADWQGTVVLPTGPATLAALPRR